MSEKFTIQLDADFAWTLISGLRLAGDMTMRAGDQIEARRLLRIANLIELRTMIEEAAPA